MASNCTHGIHWESWRMTSETAVQLSRLPLHSNDCTTLQQTDGCGGMSNCEPLPISTITMNGVARAVNTFGPFGRRTGQFTDTDTHIARGRPYPLLRY